MIDLYYLIIVTIIESNIINNFGINLVNLFMNYNIFLIVLYSEVIATS